MMRDAIHAKKEWTRAVPTSFECHRRRRARPKSLWLLISCPISLARGIYSKTVCRISVDLYYRQSACTQAWVQYEYGKSKDPKLVLYFCSSLPGLTAVPGNRTMRHGNNPPQKSWFLRQGRMVENDARGTTANPNALYLIRTSAKDSHNEVKHKNVDLCFLSSTLLYRALEMGQSVRSRSDAECPCARRAARILASNSSPRTQTSIIYSNESYKHTIAMNICWWYRRPSLKGLLGVSEESRNWDDWMWDTWTAAKRVVTKEETGRETHGAGRYGR